jgi:hypothetical protein
MRRLPLLLALLLLAALAVAASAPASSLLSDQPRPFVSLDEEEIDWEEAEGEEEGDEFEAEEPCEPEEEEELCEEEEAELKPKDREKGKGDECPLTSAKAAVNLNPGKRRLRLTVHYRTTKPATVSVGASLQGPKGTLRLGADHARFQRSGVYRETYALAEKQTKKAIAAKEFAVELRVVNAPPSCGLELSGASPRAKR